MKAGIARKMLCLGMAALLYSGLGVSYASSSPISTIQETERSSLPKGWQNSIENLGRSFEIRSRLLPSAALSLYEKGIKEDDALGLLKNIKENAREWGEAAYKYLPGALDALYKKGIKEDAALDFLEQISEDAKESAWTTYKYLPRALKALDREGRDDALDFLELTLENAKDEAWFVYDSLPRALKILDRIGIEGNDALDLLSIIIKNTKHRFSFVFPSLPSAINALHEKGIKGNKALDFLKTITDNAGKHNVIWPYKNLSTTLDAYEQINDVHSFARGYGISFKYGWYMFVRNIEDFKPDFSMIKDRKSLAEVVGKATDNYLMNHLFLTNEAADLINRLHDRDESDDLIRNTVAQNLDLKSIYYLMSIGGADLYTSSFEDLYYYNLMPGEGYPSPRFPNWLDEIKHNIDPNNKYTLDFVLTLANYNVLKQVIEKDPEFFMSTIKSAMQEKYGSDLKENGVKLVSTIQTIFTNKSLVQFKQEMEDFLINSYKSSHNNSVKRAIFGYNIKLNKDFFSDKNKQKATDISNSLPEILEPTVPKEWMDDGMLTSKQYFTQTEWLPTTRDIFFGTGARNPRTGKLQGYFEFKEVNPSPKHEPYDKRHSFVLDLHPESSIKDGRVKGKFNGIGLRTILTENLDDLANEIKNPKIDAVSHRGHSFSERDIFIPKMPRSDINKLIQLGGCGGLGRVAKLQEKLPSSYYLSDENIGKGEDNTRVLFYIMRSIAKRNNQEVIIWQEVEKDVRASYEKLGKKYPKGIIFPHHKALLLNPFINQVLKDAYGKTID